MNRWNERQVWRRLHLLQVDGFNGTEWKCLYSFQKFRYSRGPFLKVNSGIRLSIARGKLVNFLPITMAEGCPIFLSCPRLFMSFRLWHFSLTKMTRFLRKWPFHFLKMHFQQMTRRVTSVNWAISRSSSWNLIAKWGKVIRVQFWATSILGSRYSHVIENGLPNFNVVSKIDASTILTDKDGRISRFFLTRLTKPIPREQRNSTWK